MPGRRAIRLTPGDNATSNGGSSVSSHTQQGSTNKHNGTTGRRRAAAGPRQGPHKAAGAADKPPQPSAATRMTRLALEAGIDLFHDPDGRGYATVPVDGHRETWALQSAGFRRWLGGRYY